MKQDTLYILFNLFLLLLLSSTFGEYSLTPFGYHPNACIHKVPDGSHIIDIDRETGFIIVYPDGHKELHPPCSEKVHNVTNLDGEGWQVWTKYYTGNNNTDVNIFLGNFTVPQAPQEYKRQTLFIFTGLQNIDWVPPDPRPKVPFAIIQPVLQYGLSVGGGGRLWSLASWYVTLSDGFIVSEFKTVEPGDVIFGNMTKLAKDSWFIGSYVRHKAIATTLIVTKKVLTVMPWAYVTLEVYGVTSCAQYPKNSASIFTDLILYQNGQLIEPKWGVQEQKGAICGAKAQVISPSEVHLNFP